MHKKLHQLLLLIFLSFAFLPLQPRAATPDVAATLKPFVENHTLAGAVTLVASRDKVLSLEAVGYADIAANKPMQPDALFWIASMSKPMTVTALMMLVDEGTVSLDDPVEKYLPEFKGQMLAVEQDAEHMLLRRPAHPITVREILSHTSGLPFMSRLEEIQHKIDTFTLREATLGYALTPLKFAPSGKYEYSNAGINTAGRIIEVVSGLPYEEFMARHLFEPLGMKETTLRPNAAQLKRLAKSYAATPDQQGLQEIQIDQLTYPLDNPKRGPSPAGGYFSTAGDVSLFGRMILSGGVYKGRRYVSEAAICQMTSTQTGDLLSHGQGEGGYGLGWSTSRKLHEGAGQGAVAGACNHSGAYATNLSLDPERGLVTVFMVQHRNFPEPEGKKVYPTFKKAAEDAFGK